MSEVIKKWITNCIGVVMNMNPEIFAAEVMDGTIIAQILQNYNIISEEQRLKLIPTENPNIAYQNLKYIRLWLKTIEVNCSEDDIADISNGKCLSSVKLFYQIYLALHDKDELYYTAQKKKNEQLPSTDTRFEVVAVNETTDKDFTNFTDSPCSEQLVLRSGVIEWNKSRYETLASTYDAMRERYSKYLHQKFGVKQQHKLDKPPAEATTADTDLEELNKKNVVDPKDYTHDELMEQGEKAISHPIFEPNPKIASGIIKKLKHKRKEEVRANELKVQQQRLLLMDLWNKLLTEQEKELEECISTKMLRQSMFEKQMSAKMFEVRQQKNNILQNRKFVDDETLKKREEEFLENVFLRDKGINDQKYNYYFEKGRALELHKRIFAEKQRLKALRNKKICSDIVDDLVDVSLKYYSYKDMYKTEPDQRVMKQWGNLLIKGKSVFSYVDDLSEIIVQVGVPDGMEEIYCAEIHRQEGLDQRDFENYLNWEWPWDLDDLLTNYKDSLVPIELGMNVLGHNVHRILYTKYPSPQQPPKPDVPAVNVAVCVNGLPNTSVLPVLQKLLKKRRVRVIEMQDVINCCLNAFREESKIEEIDNGLVIETNAILKVLNKETKPEVPQKGSKSSKCLVVVEQEYTISFEERGTQTPLIYPCEEVVLSRKAELGKTAYDLLNVGEELTDNLVVAMFVEYLKTFKEIKGWALINYPTTFIQAVILEEALTGCQIPNVSNIVKMEMSFSIGDIADLDFREPQLDVEEKNAVLRKSRVLPNLSKPPEKQAYSTYLTAYIRIKQESDRKQEDEEDFVIPPLDDFYFEQGCNYSLYYEEFRFSQIKRLAKMILGEYAIPPKPSCELFGDTVLFLEATLGSSKKEAKPKSGTTKQLNKNQQSPVEEAATVFRDPKAGETSWHYIDLFIPEHFEIGLATFWENVENIYVNDFKQLFFLKRMAFNAVVPYLSHVKNHMTVYLSRPDNKQQHLNDFQKYYNEISSDMRDDAEVKAEIHCTIAEFREKLWEICDKRMLECETERQQIIKDYWLPNQAIEITNITISAMQLELDRSCDTFQFITDYYSGVITKMPARNPPLQKTFLNKVVTDEGNLSQQFKTTTVTILTEIGSSTSNTAFHNVIEQNYELSQTTLTKFRSTVAAIVPITEAYFVPKTAKKDTAKKDTGKKDTKPQERQLPVFVEPSEEVKAAGPHLFEEWYCCLLGEYQRARIRINMIKERGLRDIDSILNSCQKSFHGLFDDIHKRYQTEIDSVNLACEVLARAVEAEVSIQPQLILDDNKFHVQPNVLLFPEPPKKPELKLEERATETAFTIEQLEEFANVLINLAPNGSISERSFVFVLQDLLTHNAEDGKESPVPILWRKLTPQQVAKLSKVMFGDVEFIDWRDFIIYNMQLTYPTIDELLQVRNEFLEKDPDSTEIIKDSQFFSIKLWFEASFNLKDPREAFKLASIKNLFFKLYKFSDDTINYTAFLLDFCKANKPVDGFVKAITLAFGRKICTDQVLGELYVSSIKEQRFLDDQIELVRQLEREEVVKCTESVLSSLIVTTVHLCESVVIDSYHSIELQNNEEVENKIEDNPIEAENVEIDEATEAVESEAGLKDIYTNEFVDNESYTKSDDFLNVDVGFQPQYNKNYIYLLQFEAIFSIMTVSLPWHAKTQSLYDKSVRERLEVIYETLKDPIFNNHVLVHVLLNDDNFNELLSRFFKFVDKCPPKIVQMLLENN